MMASFREKYQNAAVWYEKVILMEIYHLVQTQREKNWTISKTAEDFQVSTGLVSENLRIARAIHTHERIINCKSRQDALKLLEKLS